MTIDVLRYDPAQRDAWHRLLSRAKNGLFLFDRDYMDYHAERFADFSAIALVDGKPALLCPASIDPDKAEAFSHKGLTFGGFVASPDLRSGVVIDAVNAMLNAMRQWGATRLAVRLVPPSMCQVPAGEIEFALGQRGFAVTGRDLCSQISLNRPSALSKNKMRDVTRARKLGVEIADCPIADIYPLLEQVLFDRHAAKPVHSLDELMLLQSRFPDHIVARSARLGQAVVAGLVLYRYGNVSHTQYLASGEDGRQSNALDLLIADTLECERARGVAILSLGTSMEGASINHGLMWQKESFGARSEVFMTMTGDL